MIQLIVVTIGCIKICAVPFRLSRAISRRDTNMAMARQVPRVPSVVIVFSLVINNVVKNKKCPSLRQYEYCCKDGRSRGTTLIPRGVFPWACYSYNGHAPPRSTEPCGAFFSELRGDDPFVACVFTIPQSY